LELFEASYDDDFDDLDPTTVEIDSIDTFMLQRAKGEVPCVLSQILNRITEAVRQSRALAPIDFFKVWFRKTLCDSMKDWIQKHIGETIEDMEIFNLFRSSYI
jgi:hypothetical protein